MDTVKMKETEAREPESCECQPRESALPKWAVDTLAAVALGAVVVSSLYALVGNVGYTRGASRSARIEWQRLRQSAATELEALDNEKD